MKKLSSPNEAILYRRSKDLEAKLNVAISTIKNIALARNKSVKSLQQTAVGSMIDISNMIQTPLPTEYIVYESRKK